MRRNMRPPPRKEGRIIIDNNSKRNKQCDNMYICAGRDVKSGLGITVLVGNGVGSEKRRFRLADVQSEHLRLRACGFSHARNRFPRWLRALSMFCDTPAHASMIASLMSRTAVFYTRSCINPHIR